MTGNVGGNVVGSVGSVTASVTAGTVTDNTGYSLTVTPPTAVEIRQEMDANSTQLAAIDAVTVKLDTGLVLDGAVWQWTINALENAPSGTGSTPDAIADELELRHGYGPWTK